MFCKMTTQIVPKIERDFLHRQRERSCKNKKKKGPAFFILVTEKRIGDQEWVNENPL